ncbi:MAG TPA: DinB family protein [Mycobacteriales bacterium]|nr:DinB family protein [Mycobacteriales bacterium]
MDALALISNRVGAVNSNLHAMVDRARGVDWVTPVAPGTSPIGLTLWHVPRTVDWLVNTSIQGRPEVADDPEFAGLPDARTYGFGTGLTPAEASTAAARVDPDLLLTYADTVHEGFEKWLGTLSADDLDRPAAGFDARQRTRPSYCTPAALAEIEGLGQLPLGVLLMRPAVSHLLMHFGELDVLIQMSG